jgi:hypothetical protein
MKIDSYLKSYTKTLAPKSKTTVILFMISVTMVNKRKGKYNTIRYFKRETPHSLNFYYSILS